MTSPMTTHNDALRAFAKRYVEQTLSTLAFAVRETERLQGQTVTKDQLHRLRLLVSGLDAAVVKIEGDARWGQ